MRVEVLGAQVGHSVGLPWLVGVGWHRCAGQGLPRRRGEASGVALAWGVCGLLHGRRQRGRSGLHRGLGCWLVHGDALILAELQWSGPRRVVGRLCGWAGRVAHLTLAAGWRDKKPVSVLPLVQVSEAR